MQVGLLPESRLAGHFHRREVDDVVPLVREIEVWQPLAFLIAGSEMWPDAPAWAKLVSGFWLFVFMLMPLFNRDRLRIGDMLGGTRVVVQPKPLLLPDPDRGVSRMCVQVIG